MEVVLSYYKHGVIRKYGIAPNDFIVKPHKKRKKRAEKLRRRYMVKTKVK